jgi:hypothetical protein
MPPSLIDQEVTKGPSGSIEFCDKESTSRAKRERRAREALQTPATGMSLISIADTRKWIYSYSYEKAEALQDTVYTNIRFNVKPPGQAFKESDEEPDLFESLAMFVNAYPLVQNDFVNALANVNQQSSPEEIEIAKKAIAAFVFLVQKAASAWGRWLADRSKYIKDLEVKEPYEFSIFESDDNGRFKVTMTMTGTKDDIQMPLMVFKDYVPCFITDDQKARICLFRLAEDPMVFLSWETAQSVRQRQLEFSSLDIMKTQNAWAGIFVTRNENLFSDSRNIRLANAVERTNPNFIYQTPTVRFANLLTPLLDYKERINIATLDPAQPQFDYLINHLRMLFTKYFENVAEPEQVTSRKVKLSCSYLYSIGGMGGGLQEPLVVTLPVRLAPPFDFVIPDDCGKDCETFNSFICRLTESILDWFRTNRPSRDEGEFLFDVATYSSLSDSKLPVYRLEELYLKVTDIKDLAPQEPA